MERGADLTMIKKEILVVEDEKKYFRGYIKPNAK